MNNTAISLYELNNLVRSVITANLSDMFWIRAEMSDVRVNQNGHCYLEFIEKDTSGRTIVAKARAAIWAKTFNLIKIYFEETTKQAFTSGLKVLVQVSVEFHELYGFSLTVQDIDPSYTLGDQAMNRTLILNQLEEEGVRYLNKELELPTPLHRIAIISSPTAAGYEDFCNQLENNTFGFVFYTKLFPAIMQGDRSEDSIILALERIYAYQDCFDAVVIIRGGGATSDLSCFDSYLLAASCAQFPLPIITGIGHERDETVLDMVAHTRAKTPTAVAEFLIDNIMQTAGVLADMQLTITSAMNRRLQGETIKISKFESQITYELKDWHKSQTNILNAVKSNLTRHLQQSFKNSNSRLNMFAKHLELLSPENILKKGYTLTMKEGKIVKESRSLKQGDQITTLFAKGKIDSIIK